MRVMGDTGPTSKALHSDLGIFSLAKRFMCAKVRLEVILNCQTHSTDPAVRCAAPTTRTEIEAKTDSLMAQAEVKKYMLSAESN